MKLSRGNIVFTFSSFLIAPAVYGRGLRCTHQPWGSAGCSFDDASEAHLLEYVGAEQRTTSWRTLLQDDATTNSGSPQPALGHNAAFPSSAPASAEAPLRDVALAPAVRPYGPFAPPPSSHPPGPTGQEWGTGWPTSHSACGTVSLAGCATGIVVALLVVVALATWATLKLLRRTPSRSPWLLGPSTSDSSNAIVLQEGQRVFYHIPGHENDVGTLQECKDGDECCIVMKDGEHSSVRLAKAHVAPYYERGTPLMYTAYDGKQSMCTVIESNVSQWPASYYIREETSGREISTFARNLTPVQGSKPFALAPGASWQLNKNVF